MTTQRMGELPSSPDDYWRLFQDASESAAALRKAAARAQEILGPRGWAVTRLSDLLDEVLPTDRAEQDRIAQAIALPASELDALRRHRVDPLMLSPFAIVNLASEFGIPREQLNQLLIADHKPYENTSVSARGAAIADAWSQLDAEWDRVRSENPARFTMPEDSGASE